MSEPTSKIVPLPASLGGLVSGAGGSGYALAMYVVVVNVSVKPEAVAQFIVATKDNHLHTREEPENRRFDVVQRNDDPNRFVLYEVYTSEAGFVAHQQTAHYARWRDAVAPMMAEPRSPQRCTNLFPEPWA